MYQPNIAYFREPETEIIKTPPRPEIPYIDQIIPPEKTPNDRGDDWDDIFDTIIRDKKPKVPPWIMLEQRLN